MFEKSDSFIHALSEGGMMPDGGVHSSVSSAQIAGDLGSPRGGDALRAIEWSELTARLNAARDLRRELRQDTIICAGATSASFGDAAARFFRSLGDGERPVNPEALEGCKASGSTFPAQRETAAQGDARDKL